MRFSDQQLFAIRNHIPIKTVIADILGMASKISQGTFRFQCPLCTKFNTAVNPRTNMARCFGCEKNFNPIDIVMVVRNISFVQTVNLLKKYKKTPPYNRNQDYQDTALCINADPSVNSREKTKNPIAIGDMLPNLISKDKIDNQRPKKADSCHCSPQLENSIAKLQQDIYYLSQLLEQLKIMIDNQYRK